MNHEHDEKESLISELSERLSNGLFKENPTFVLLLGMCPTLAVTTSAKNGLGMGLTTMVVLALSNLFISALRKIIPDKIRIPAFIVIIASFVTMVELLLNAYIPSLYKELGIYIPLIVVNCIILGRAEAYAYSHRPLPSLFDGLGMGLGFTMALTIIGSLRELIGAGSLFGAHIMPKGYVPVSIFIMAPGAFFVLACLTAIQNKVKEIGEKKGKDMSIIQSGCGGNCLSCDKECKVELVKTEGEKTSNEALEAPKAEKPLKKEKVSVKKEEPKEPASKKDSTKQTEDKLPLKKDETKKVSSEKKEKAEASVSKKVTLKAEKEGEAENKEEIEKPKASKPSKSTASKKTEDKKEVKDVKEEKEQKAEDLEIIDFSDIKKAISQNSSVSKKPVRKRSSLEKAQEMLDRAKEATKEEKND